MRIASPFLVLVAAASVAGSLPKYGLGNWKVNPVRSTNPYPGSFVLRIEPHPKGEVFTLDRVDVQGRNTTSSTVLYLDGKPRVLGLPGCAGTQSSRRLDSRTVEILRNCGSGEWMRFVRRLTQPKEMVLEITEKRLDGSRLERRLVLEKE
jgi:hypothetical protein